jgi:invasion protein IalB
MIRTSLLFVCFLAAAFSQATMKAALAQVKKPEAPKADAKKGNEGAAVMQYGDWTVFTGQTPKGKICYAGSQPKERLPKELKRDPAFLLITTRPSDKIINDFSLVTGFAMKKDEDATLTIGTQSFPLFTKDTGAWVKVANDEPKVLAAMKNGQNLVFKANSARGNALSDNYSLNGLSQALERVAAECR